MKEKKWTNTSSIATRVTQDRTGELTPRQFTLTTRPYMYNLPDDGPRQAMWQPPSLILFAMMCLCTCFLLWLCWLVAVSLFLSFNSGCGESFNSRLEVYREHNTISAYKVTLEFSTIRESASEKRITNTFRVLEAVYSIQTEKNTLEISWTLISKNSDLSNKMRKKIDCGVKES